MSDFDYKANYEAALERARQIHDGNPSSGTAMVVCEQIFPELAESEDERIRKMLLDQMLRWKEMACKEGVEQDIKDSSKAIAWLEKQKESLHISETCKEKPDSFIDSVIEVRSFQRGLAEGRRQEQRKQKGLDKMIVVSPEVWSNAIADAYENGKKDGKKQKPVMIQWTGKNLKEVIDFTGKSPKFGEWFKSWEDFENYVHSHDDIIKLFCEDGSHYEVPVGAWIVKTPDGYNTPSRFRFIQKSAEWSEEDRKMIDHLIEALPMWANGRIAMLPSQADEYVERLKSLHPQPKQEWSEEDKKMLRTIISDGSRGVELDSKQISWLKSLRPQNHWKPSEKQMIALFQAKSKYIWDGLHPFDKGLISLYYDLEKLSHEG